MIADLKPYPEYKESGLPWLGQMPGHWAQRRMKFLFRERVQKGFPDEPLLAATQSKGVVRKEDYGTRTVTAMKDFHLLKLVVKGDFVISLRSFQGGLEVAHCRGIISPAYTVLEPRSEALNGYYSRFFKSPDFISSLTLFVTGIREGQNIDYERLSRAYMPLPPLDEQLAIGRFLDWATGRLTRTIRAKRKVVALLNEQKQAIIHRAVTRGLDPSVPLKPSGIPWIGDIPHHWELRRFKFLATINSGQVDPRKRVYSDMVLIAPNHIESGSGRLLATETAAKQGADSGKYLVTRGQIIYSKIRPNLRKATIAPCDCLCSADMYPITPKTMELSPEYLLMILLSPAFTKFAVDASMRVAMPKVNREALAGCLLWFPGIVEQAQILRIIDRESTPIDTAISRLEREIQLLREYRTRLIADVVTGKLDVRSVRCEGGSVNEDIAETEENEEFTEDEQND
ncbi:MAG: restriction endonuclease subunit S [Desulfobacteraceae bacterium]|nr:MAG: restriction endonuclease subunit S [Desulfobacteraceae bacterium]